MRRRFGVKYYYSEKILELKKVFTGILDYLYLCRGIQCKGRREARARLRRGGDVEGPESVLYPLGPCEKGLGGEWGEKLYRGRGELGGAVSAD